MTQASQAQASQAQAYARYIAKYRMLGQEPPLSILEDSEGRHWIVDLNLAEIEASTYVLQIPKFIEGFLPIKDIGSKFEIEKDGVRTVIEFREPSTIHKLKHMQLYNRVNNGNKIDTLIVDGNNVPLKGQLKGAFEKLTCKKLVFKNFDAQEIECLDYCLNKSEVEEIDFNGFIQKNIRQIKGTFSSCSNIKQIDIQNFKFGHGLNMQKAFESCTRLREIKLPDTPITVDSCSNHKEIRVIGAELKISRHNGLYRTFFYCAELVKVNTDKIKCNSQIDLDMTFCQCEQLESVDLQQIDASMIGYFGLTFAGMPQLKEIKFKRAGLGRKMSVQEFKQTTKAKAYDMFYDTDTSNIVIYT